MQGPSADAMLADIFPELLPQTRGYQFISQVEDRLDGGILIYGEPLLTPELRQAWRGAGRIKRENCVHLLHATVHQFERIQHKVANEQCWDDDVKAVKTPEQRADDPLTGERKLNRRKSDLHALFVNCLPGDKPKEVLSVVLCEVGKRMLALPSVTHAVQEYREDHEVIPNDSQGATSYLRRLGKRLSEVGLGGGLAERAYATAADRMLDSFIDTTVGDINSWYHLLTDGVKQGLFPPGNRPMCPIQALEDSMIRRFCPVLHEFMSPLDSLSENALGLDRGFRWSSPPQGNSRRTSQEMLALGADKNIVFWCERARNKLRDIRSQQAYDIIITRDKVVRKYGLLDIRELSKEPYGRNLVAQGLEKTIDRRLVRPGTSTVEILDTYMRIIGTLSQTICNGERVDPSNVLLTRSAGPLRHFLRNREDAARIVIMSLLEPRPAEGTTASGGEHRTLQSTDKTSGLISAAMYHHENPHSVADDFEGHDLSDINWEPEPVDALSGHRFNTSLDAIGHITTVAPDASFIGQLEQILGERLLNTDQLSFEVEMRVLKIFHARFGEAQIQACENMLNDMMESTKWNEKIQSTKKPTPPKNTEHAFQAKIISQTSWIELSWDQLQKTRFNLPPEMQTMVSDFDARFGELQDDRHLEWAPQLGRVSVDIEFEDRTISEEVTPLQAAVIHQFTQPDTAVSEQTYSTLTLTSIKEALQGEEKSIRAALQFWVAKLVLQPSATDPDTYTTIETLTPASEAAAAAVAEQQQRVTEAAEASVVAAAAPSRAELLEQHSTTYAAYIQGMLTNQGAMEVGRIHTLLRMLAPGGFAFDVDDLVGILEEMERKGHIRPQGGLWMIVES